MSDRVMSKNDEELLGLCYECGFNAAQLSMGADEISHWKGIRREFWLSGHKAGQLELDAMMTPAPPKTFADKIIRFLGLG